MRLSELHTRYNTCRSAIVNHALRAPPSGQYPEPSSAFCDGIRAVIATCEIGFRLPTLAAGVRSSLRRSTPRSLTSSRNAEYQDVLAPLRQAAEFEDADDRLLDLSGKSILLHSLIETAGVRAKSYIEQRVTCQVSVDASLVGNDALRTAAASADVVVVAWRAVKHSAYDTLKAAPRPGARDMRGQGLVEPRRRPPAVVPGFVSARCSALQEVDLVLHQGDQRRHDQRHRVEQQCRGPVGTRWQSAACLTGQAAPCSQKERTIRRNWTAPVPPLGRAAVRRPA
jgi:hypothetical protein